MFNLSQVTLPLLVAPAPGNSGLRLFGREDREGSLNTYSISYETSHVSECVFSRIYVLVS